MNQKIQRGFTLVEVLVIAPIIILSIGAFVALIVTLTGNTLASRGSSVMQYEVHDALERIEKDVKESAAFLAVNDITLASTNPQGYVANPNANTTSTVNFSNVDKTASNGSPKSLILKKFATREDGMDGSQVGALVYLANSPNSCSGDFRRNTPMYVNVVYFVADGTLWRRTITPTNYATASAYCGNQTSQRPSCSMGASHSYCKVKDTRLLEGIKDDGFGFQVSYFNTPGASSVNTSANNPSATDAARNAALSIVTTVRVYLETNRTIAGRDVSKGDSIRATRLNSTSTASKPTMPNKLQTSVFDGRKVSFSWQAADGANIYDVEYRINGGAWQFGATLNNEYYYIVTANHADTVEARVAARNTSGASSYATGSASIPLWTPLPLTAGWENYGQGYTTGAYTRTSAGLVIIKGLLRNLGSPAIDTTIATLPADYWPTGRLMFGTSTNPNASSRLDVTQTGSIQFHDNSSAPWVSMDTIRYTAANAGYTRTTPTLLNGFTNYGSVYAPASYVQDSAGRVSIQGLLANGTRTNGTVIFTIPAALRPALYQHHPSRSGAFHHLGIDNASGLLAKGDGSGAYSINSTYLPSSHTGWNALSLTSSWVVYGDIFSTPQYTKTSDGVVHLKGLIKSGTIGSVPLATLPAGFRPSERVLSATVSAGGYGRIDILANGQIHATTGANSWYALDGISFLAEQ